MSNFLYALAVSIALSYFKTKIQDWIETKRKRKRTGTCKCWTLEQNPYLPGQKEKGRSTIGVLKSRFPAFFLLNPAIPPLFMPGSWSRPIFLRDFWHFLLDHWNMHYDLPSNNCQFWWSRFSTSQLATITLFSVLLNYFFVLASVHVYLDTLSPVFLELGRLMLSVCLTKIRLLCC